MLVLDLLQISFLSVGKRFHCISIFTVSFLPFILFHFAEHCLFRYSCVFYCYCILVLCVIFSLVSSGYCVTIAYWCGVYFPLFFLLFPVAVVLLFGLLFWFHCCCLFNVLLCLLLFIHSFSSCFAV